MGLFIKIATIIAKGLIIVSGEVHVQQLTQSSKGSRMTHDYYWGGIDEETEAQRGEVLLPHHTAHGRKSKNVNANPSEYRAWTSVYTGFASALCTLQGLKAIKLAAA